MKYKDHIYLFIFLFLLLSLYYCRYYLIENSIPHTCGSLVVSGGYDKKLKVWDIRTPHSMTAVAEGSLPGKCYSVSVSEHYTLACAMSNQTVAVYDIRNLSSCSSCSSSSSSRTNPTALLNSNNSSNMLKEPSQVTQLQFQV